MTTAFYNLVLLDNTIDIILNIGISTCEKDRSKS